MIKVHRLSVGEMRSNCYLLQYDDRCIIIDPGDDSDFITNKILELKLKPKFIASTHGHIDHNMASYEVSKNFDIPFYISERDVFLIKKMKETAKVWFRRNDILIPKIEPVEKMPLKLGKHKIEIIDIPGHTPGSVAYYVPLSKIMFVGDLIFEAGGLGRVDFQYSDKKDFISSLDKVLTYPKDTQIYPGHGEYFLLSEFNI